VCNFVSSTVRQIHVAVRCTILTAGQLLFDVRGFVWYRSMGWVGSGQLFGELGWAESMKIDLRTTLLCGVIKL